MRSSAGRVCDWCSLLISIQRRLMDDGNTTWRCRTNNISYIRRTRCRVRRTTRWTTRRTPVRDDCINSPSSVFAVVIVMTDDRWPMTEDAVSENAAEYNAKLADASSLLTVHDTRFKQCPITDTNIYLIFLFYLISFRFENNILDIFFNIATDRFWEFEKLECLVGLWSDVMAAGWRLNTLNIRILIVYVDYTGRRPEADYISGLHSSQYIYIYIYIYHNMLFS